ncbi:hypothetical protein KK083_31360 [Fulvivirgaceae bacterium PWU4]|uniref:Uncharacterized protein n=1 Tax=Chryseosolibacter histidini TaxID=2782349 RepID=A0AAP2DTX5_9BACT|nr:hypothetical protein [Chryseosolibacter histidini]MBT1701434.1 hypothetical protein [Chryseosolibacter histidini]
MKASIRRSLPLVTALMVFVSVRAQDTGFIYGKVYTEDNRTYEGPIRWGKEEIYWNDIFNATKERNEHLRHLSDRERDLLDDRNYDWFNWDNNLTRWLGSSHWHSDGGDYIHQFACQFGEIKSLRPAGKKYVELELRNGQKFEVGGEGYNDVGLDIRITDKEIGDVEVYWGRIEKVEFMDTPSKLEQKFGQPLYGTVEAYGEKFAGYIQWDHDERISTDKLDGDSDDGDVAIEFSKIRSITRHGSRSLVVLKSGRELWLDGSNDVSSGHRGVIVMSKEFTAVDIPWREFEKVVFEDKTPEPICTYKDFAAQRELSGKVTTHDGKSFSGRIIYDLDESHEYELLQGKNGEFEYITAFRNIKKITTKGEHRATIELKTGKKITLEEAQDVNERNQGLLIFAPGKSDPAYVPWNEVTEIEFK